MTEQRVGKGIRVLFMDDDERICDIMQKHFDYMGYEVEIAGDGAMAAEMYRNALDGGRRFDVVVLDLTVKCGLSGLVAMKQILQNDPSAIGIITSGNFTEAAIRDFKSFGFQASFEKPFGFDEISEKIIELVKKKKTVS